MLAQLPLGPHVGYTGYPCPQCKQNTNHKIFGVEKGQAPNTKLPKECIQCGTIST